MKLTYHHVLDVTRIQVYYGASNREVNSLREDCTNVLQGSFNCGEVHVLILWLMYGVGSLCSYSPVSYSSISASSQKFIRIKALVFLQRVNSLGSSCPCDKVHVVCLHASFSAPQTHEDQRSLDTYLAQATGPASSIPKPRADTSKA